MTALTVGFAGIGTMGSGMCRNLVKAGFSVFVWNRTRDKAEAIQGVSVVEKPADLCKNCGVVFTCVSNDTALKEVLFSPYGIMSALEEKNVLIDSSTTSVSFTAEIAKKCAERKTAFLDVPLTGSKTGAEQGTLLIMVGGEKTVLDKCLPVLNAMAKKVVHCGPNTYGQRVKIALNLTQSMILEAYFEGLVLGLKEGVSLGAIQEVFDNAGPRNNAALAAMPNVLARNFEPHFLLELMNKDMKLAKEEIEKLHLELPLARAVISVFQEATDKGFGRENWSAIVKLLEEKAGVVVQNK